MKNPTVTIKIWKETRDNLRLLSAYTGVSMSQLLDTWAKQEVDKVHQLRDSVIGRILNVDYVLFPAHLIRKINSETFRLWPPNGYSFVPETFDQFTESEVAEIVRIMDNQGYSRIGRIQNSPTSTYSP